MFYQVFATDIVNGNFEKVSTLENFFMLYDYLTNELGDWFEGITYRQELCKLSKSFSNLLAWEREHAFAENSCETIDIGDTRYYVFPIEGIVTDSYELTLE